jgi:molybdopterin synthase sulfur carrier subunit
VTDRPVADSSVADPSSTTVRVALSAHLRTLASVEGELQLEVADPPTISTVLDALESRYPMLRGTIRDHGTDRRRAFMRFFACGIDISHDPPDALLPDSVSAGTDTFHVIGAIAGG